MKRTMQVPLQKGKEPDGSVTEHSSSADEKANAVADADTHVLKMLYKGNMAEISRKEQQSKKAHVFNRKHNCYRNTRCTSVAQEEQSALPAGVININEDSDDDEAYHITCAGILDCRLYL